MSSATSELLPDPTTPVTHVSTPFGIRTVRLRRLLDVAFSMRNASSKVRRLRLGEATRSPRARDVAVSARSRSSRRPQKTSSPPPSPARGADVDDPVRRADDGRVVLDDEHRVAVVTQALEHGDEVIDVPRMEPHGRLFQDVDEIDEVAVELPGHLHPLALAAGQRRHAAVERQVADADVDQVPEGSTHPGDQRRDHVADRFVVVPRDELLEHAVQLRQLAVDEPANGPPARQLHPARRGVEPNSAAIRARPLREQPPVGLLAGARDLILVPVDVQPLKLAGDAFEGPLVRRALVDLLDPHVVRPQQALPFGRREPTQRLAGRDDVGLDDLPPVPLPIS